MVELRAYVKEHHTTGLTWNPKGMEYGTVPAGTTPAVTPSADVTSTAAAVTAAVTTAPVVVEKAGLFAALSLGEGVTSGLKKVTKEQQTWRSEYKGVTEGTTVASTAPKPAASTASNKSTIATGEAKCELKSDKWVLDFLTPSAGLGTDVTITDIKQTVYLYKCDGATVQVNGKCKSIIVDSCRNVSLHFTDLVAGLEIVYSKSTKVVID